MLLHLCVHVCFLFKVDAATLSSGGVRAEHVRNIDVRVKFMYIFGMWQGQALAKAAEKVEGDYAEQLQLKGAFT